MDKISISIVEVKEECFFVIKDFVNEICENKTENKIKKSVRENLEDKKVKL